MKKIFIALALIVVAFQLKAQQFILKPTDSSLLKGPMILPDFQLNKDSTLIGKFFTIPKQEPFLALKGLKNNDAEIFYSRMPVAKLKAADNNMLIVKPKSNERYTMLTKRIKVVDPLAKTPLPAPFTQNPYSPVSPVPQNQY